MCPNETAHLTYEFKDHFLINSTDLKKNKNKLKNKIGEVGIKVKKDFEYSSGKNKFLTLNEIKKLNDNLEIDSL